ncbi:hypothetical protein GALMADRAFT_143928 [Galerina marginata CBS 339.88]|uniref:DUF6534 domain-containing protein n=1 Tax=Galerina marginata (strain CBS 339.88) TaxID=685588 RepID=A0A067SME8_GALM3|nr:hypothetical protein GALMADRAFT_143928 [Galerina marginata CBS 339.88]
MLPPLPPDVASKTGPRLLGYLFNYGLFGLLCMQVYMFFISFPKDPLRNKVLVYTIFALEVLQTVIVTISAFHVFASGYGDFSVYNSVDLAWLDVPIISGLVAFIAEGFYAYRISILSQSTWVAMVIMLLATLQLGGSIAAAVVLKNAVLFSNLLSVQYSITAALWNGGSALCDVIIAVCMTYYLSSRASESMKSTNVVVRRVITLVIETGTVTAAIAIINLILSVLPSKPAYYQLPSVILAKVYSNSMMAVLNSRMRTGPEISEVSGRTAKPHGTSVVSGSRQTNDTFELGESITITREEYMSSGEGEYAGPGRKSFRDKTYLV